MTTTQFIESYSPLENKLYAFAVKLTRNHSAAKDLLQETLTKAYSNRSKFTMGTNFKSWITTIMRNAFINDYRKNKKRGEVEHPIENYTYAVESKAISNGSESTIMMKELRSIINEVKPKYRIPFLMHYQGYEYKDIATELNIPVGTVKSRLHTARQQLRKLIRINYPNISEFKRA